VSAYIHIYIYILYIYINSANPQNAWLSLPF
jgi:hypothetical protein